MPTLQLSTQDLSQLSKWGISKKEVLLQWNMLHRERQYTELQDSVKLGAGVLRLSPELADQAVSYYHDLRDRLSIVKFVPASGAASRMFKDFNQILNKIKSATDSQEFQSVWKRFDELPFTKQLTAYWSGTEQSLMQLLHDNQYHEVLRALLDPEALGYGNLPKLLIPFHKYDHGTRTALEEHLVEGLLYARSGRTARIHFTVSTGHLDDVQKFTKNISSSYQSKYGANLDITLSTQSPATNTVALDQEGQLFRYDNQIYTRPGGHGALLKNVQDLDAELVFIKNVDNVFPEHKSQTMVKYKNVLAGLLLMGRDKLFNFIQLLMSKNYSEDLEVEILDTLATDWGFRPSADYHTWEQDKRYEFLFSKLNRPLRAVGVIKTATATGGGPYWVQQGEGVSIQIVEDPQIANTASQQTIKRSNTFANVTDLVLYKKNYLGQEFALSDFVDEDTSFISTKSFQGKEIRCLELPGLWNGSMAHWNTMLVEVPPETFAPVKTVYDLVNDVHLSS